MKSRHLCLLYTALLIAASLRAAAGTQALTRVLLADEAHETLAVQQNEPTQAVQEVFQSMIATADRIFVESKDEQAVALQIRAALQMCPTCAAGDTLGKITGPIFYLDEYKDRTFMAQSILPAIFEDTTIHKLLWVGIQPYTLRYEYVMRQHGIEMTTIEVDPNQAMYGSSSRHVIGPIQNVHEHLSGEVFDAIIINGVIGWGVNSDSQIKHAIKAMHRVLRPGGLLVVGYNAGMVECCAQFTPLFIPTQLGELAQTVDMAESELHHVYEFFRRDASESQRTESTRSLGHSKTRLERRH